MGSDEDGLTTAVWELDPDEAPSGSIEERARHLLRYAILAPSSHNSQPWRFTVDDGRIGISADESRWLEVADRNRRELHVSLGCALENVCIAAERFGFEYDVDYHDDGDRIAVVALHPDGSPPSDRPPGLFEEITERHTSHGLFDGEALPHSVVETFRECVLEDDVSLHLIDDDDRRHAIGELQAAADRLQMDRPEYRRELGYWVGIGALGDSWLSARIAQTVVTHLDLGDRESRKNSKLIRSAPLLGLLVTSSDDPSARVRAGQVYERIALAASAAGVATHPMSQILELPDKRDELVDRLGIDGVPQHLFRSGYGDERREHTPRWPLEKFIADTE